MAASLIVDLPTAYARRKEPAANWESVAGSFDGDVWPVVKPSFTLSAKDTVFTIGSCFARNIEDNLDQLGCRVPMLDFELPPEEWHGRANGALNRFTPPSFRQIIEWTVAIAEGGGVVEWDRDCAPLAFDVGGELFLDLDMEMTIPVGRERFLQRRQHIFDVFKSVLSADCLMMTPGYIEAWYDMEAGRYIQGAPKHRRVLGAADRFRFELLSYEQCHADLLAAVDLVRARNPGIKVVITTSPVPLAVTFTGQDIRVANAYSKSVLRAACGRISLERELVDYFPSYESVTLSFPSGVWQPDRIHVTGGFVGKIVTRLSELYLSGVDRADATCQRALTALRTGDIAGGEAAAREALDISPEHAEARFILCETLLAQRRWDEAEQLLRQLREELPDRADIAIRLARCVVHLDRKRLAEAVAVARAGAELDSASIKDLSWVVALLAKRGRMPEEAEALARRITERFPRHGPAYQPLIDLLMSADRDDEALSILEKVVKLPLPTAGNWLQAAKLMLKAGDARTARTYALMAQRRNAREPGLDAFLAEVAPETRKSAAAG